MVGEVCSVMEKDKERHAKLYGGLRSMKLEMEAVIALMKDKDTECRGAVQEIRFQQLQELAYDVEDFVAGLWDPAAYGKLLVAIRMDPRTEQLRSIEQFKETISSLANDLKHQSTEPDTDQGAAISSDPDEDDAEEEQLEAMDGPKSKIIELLKPSPGEGQQLRVISIVGCRGVGKTALARAVYDKYSSSDEFDCVAWVIASGRNKKKALLDKILESVLADLASRPAPHHTEGNAPSTEAEGASTAKLSLRDILSDKRSVSQSFNFGECFYFFYIYMFQVFNG
jgi:disease resistance protein RPM1